MDIKRKFQAIVADAGITGSAYANNYVAAIETTDTDKALAFMAYMQQAGIVTNIVTGYNKVTESPFVKACFC